MTQALSATSLKRLHDVKPELAGVVILAAQRCELALLVVEGLRTPERQRELYAKGRTTAGPVVTWTMQSKHLTGDAVDVAPLLPDGSIPWNNTKAFDTVAAAMFAAAAERGVSIRWGADWDGDGKPRERGETDSPHFELA